MFGASLNRGLPAGKRQSPGTPPAKPSAPSSAAVKQQVKPFTKESLERLENKTIQLVRDYGFQPRRKLSVEDGSVLPHKFEPFPSTLYGRPLEEIDNFIYDETFCVVSKRFNKNYIHRFTATRAFFIFSPWNKIRQTCIFLSTNQYFDYVVMATILLNCVFLAMTEPVDEAEFVFLAIYTAEMMIKAVAKGFILNKYTYLRNPWNWLDFVVITSGYVTSGLEVGNLAGLRTFRVLRALKTVSIMPGLKTIINALLHSFKQLAEVMTLTIFCLMVFALFALQVYMGELRNKCVIISERNYTGREWLQYVWNESSWQRDDDDNVIMCGNTTGSRHCEEGYVCLRVGPNPNFGYTNFDNFLWSMLTTFQLITLDYWENVYNMVLATCGPISVIFFTVVVFFGSFYLINLMLAVVALSYEEEAEITQEEQKKDLVDHRDDSTFSFDPKDLNVKQLDKNKKKTIDSRKGVLLSSYTKKKTRRRKVKGKEGNGKSNGLEESGPSPLTPSPTPKQRTGPDLRPTSTPTHRARPHMLPIQSGAVASPHPPPDTLRPENIHGVSRGQLSSRQASSNSGEGNCRESSLDDSGVVDDHEEPDHDPDAVYEVETRLQQLALSTPTAVVEADQPESVTIAITADDQVRILKCNGILAAKQDPKKLLHSNLYSLPPDFLSHVVVLDSLVDRNCAACISCCIDYDGWLRFQNCLYKLVRDPLFELLITICIILNTIFLAVEHHGMSEHVREALDIGNKVFTSIFTFECFLKLLALSKEFFDCGWNIFDLIIVSASLLDLSIEIMDGLTVLRGLRLLRVLKLAQSWTTMKVLLSIIISTIGALGNLTFVLVIVIYIFAVIGMQLFSKDYTSEKFAPDPVPRWNFNDFFHSFMMIFRILCGEWIEPLWDCMRAEASSGAETCFFIFLPALVMGNFMVLNLFLALLLNSFNSEELKNKKEEVGEESKISRSFDRIRSIVKKKKLKPEHADKDNNNMKMEEMVRQLIVQRTQPIGHQQVEPLSNQSPYPRKVASVSETAFSNGLQTHPLNCNKMYGSDLHVDMFGSTPHFPSSPDLSRQLEEVLDEKIKSLQSSRIQLFEFGDLTLSRTSVRSSNSGKLLSPPVEEVYRDTLSGSLWNYSQSPLVQRPYTPRPSQHQLTFISPLPSDSASSGLKTGLANISRCSDNVDLSICEKGRRSSAVSAASDLNERTSLGVSDPVFRDLSESDPVYSPPSGSSVSDGLYSVVFSPPSEANNSFSPSTDKPSTILSPALGKKSILQSQVEATRPLSSSSSSSPPIESLHDTPKSTSEGALTSAFPHREKRYCTVVQTASLDNKESVVDTAENGLPKTARDKRLSYFLAIEQGESKDSDSHEVIKGEKSEENIPDRSQEVMEKSKKPWQALVSYVDELTVGGRRDSQGRYVDGLGSFPGFGRNRKNVTPQDCFPLHCYQRSVCCNHCLETDIGQKWTRCRTYVLSYVDTPVFEWVILILIFSSSITLCFEDIYLDDNKPLKTILYWTNFIFCALFSVEMLLKWIALGFWKYFTSFWTILDFIIVFVSIFSLLIEENENLKVLRSLRTLRALRPLRAISRWQGMRIVVNALMYAIPSIFNVLLVCLVFWLIFSIMGVQFFGGKFFKCLDEEGELLPISIVNDGSECLEKNFSWINSKITFDHVGQAYLALFQVATFEGWMEVMADAVDARGEDLQPQREANLYAYVYFVIFIVCGSFFTLNLFIGVIIDNFNMLKKKYEGGVLEMFLTESQKHYYTAMKKLGRKKPQKVIHRPLNQFLAMFYDLSNSRRFEIAIFILIFLNMVSMAIEHYDQPHAIFFVLEVSNAFFTTVFSLEATVKIIGLRYHYFTVPWNMFDFLLVLASILGILMEDIMIDFPVSPTLLRVVRVFRIGRILRLIKAAKGIRKLLFALVVSLPALFNIGALLALITFIYAIIGMSLFGHVKKQGALDDMVNFETFGRSMQLLFRLMTSAGWNDVLESLMIQPPDCDNHKSGTPNGDCGHPLLAITYFTSFIIISYMIVINMYIAIILENFNQAHQEEEIGIVEDDLEMFYIRWSKYDPHATQFIRFQQLSDFIASLDPPLGIPKPNTVALVSFNLPIARGNRIHCLDILHSLVKHVLGHVEESDDFKKLQDQMDVKFKKQFPTRKELEIVSSTRIWKRQDKAARLIQKMFQEYLRRKKEKEGEDLEDEMTQTSSPGGGWHSRLSAFLHVHRGSRASSRKSSRASDASDLSELGGPWLNLPILLLGGAQMPNKDEEIKGKVCITVSEPSPENAEPKKVSLGAQYLAPRVPVRRGSFSFLQRKPSNKETNSHKLTRHNSAKEPTTRRSLKSMSQVPEIVGKEDKSQAKVEEDTATEESLTKTNTAREATSATKRRAAFRLSSNSQTLVDALVHENAEQHLSGSGS